MITDIKERGGDPSPSEIERCIGNLNDQDAVFSKNANNFAKSLDRIWEMFQNAQHCDDVKGVIRKPRVEHGAVFHRKLKRLIGVLYGMEREIYPACLKAAPLCHSEKKTEGAANLQ